MTESTQYGKNRKEAESDQEGQVLVRASNRYDTVSAASTGIGIFEEPSEVTI